MSCYRTEDALLGVLQDVVAVAVVAGEAVVVVTDVRSTDKTLAREVVRLRAGL